MKSTKAVILLLCIFILSCQGSNIKNGKEQKDSVIFRLLPCNDIKTYSNKKPELLRLYAITTVKDSADKYLLSKIDSFVCKEMLDSIEVNNYSSVVIGFLKETYLTKKLINNSVTDSHNPYGADHFQFARYLWLNGRYNYKTINNDSYINEEKIECK